GAGVVRCVVTVRDSVGCWRSRCVPAEHNPMSAWALYLLLLRATLTSFSGFASVPVVRDDLVLHRHVLTDDQLNAALAISQISTGPLGLYVVVVGYFVAGVTGAVAGMCALATPAVFAIPIFRASMRGRTET